MEDSTILYFIGKLDYIRLIFILMLIISGFYLFAFLFVSADGASPSLNFLAKASLIIFIVSVIACIFIPNTEEGHALYKNEYRLPSPKEK